MKVRVLLLFAISLCLFQISFGQDSAANLTPQGYLLGPGDVVEGKVLGEEQFNFVSTVDDDGKIQVPFFEQGVVAQCRTEKELKADVAKLLSKYLKNPQISVRVTERNRPLVTVSGEIKKPGQVKILRETRLLELISFSDGPTEDTNGMIQVFRTQPPMCSDEQATKDWKAATNNGIDIPSRMYSLTSLLQGRDESNPVIYPGDVIVVQKASPIYITGEVKQPVGLYLKEGGLSLYQAISMVGGVNREAKTKQIKIYRLKPNSKDRTTIVANFDAIKKGTEKDVMLEPYDIIEVDKAKEPIAKTILSLITGVGKTMITSGANSIGYRVLY
jgi:polysaccharide export outer membrane protein